MSAQFARQPVQSRKVLARGASQPHNRGVGASYAARQWSAEAAVSAGAQHSSISDHLEPVETAKFRAAPGGVPGRRTITEPAIVPTPKQKRSQLDSAGREGVLVGYSEEQRAYRVLFGERVETSCSVRFYEGVRVPAVGADSLPSTVLDLTVREQEEPAEEGDDLDQSE